MKCHYEVLSVPREADDGEIKVAYRKQALKWHPDKNLDNAEEAKVQFQLIQAAYEVLSDRQERAWYDNHREQILLGGDKDYEDNSLDVFQYFTTSCFKGYGNDEGGFYAIYRQVFIDLAAEDLEHCEEEFDVPDFGYKDSDYEEVVAPFYAYWSNYTTKKSYVWLDAHNLSETKVKKIAKLMEKENKKIRAKAKKERNEEIRNLVAFIKKRDKRVQLQAKKMEEKAKENKAKQEEMNSKRRVERRKERESMEQAEWTKFDNVKSELEEIEKKVAEQFGEDSAEEEEDDEDFYCIACNKVFRTDRAFMNHESSKKHKENVLKLKETMLEEENDLDGGEEEETDEELIQEENGDLHSVDGESVDSVEELIDDSAEHELDIKDTFETKQKSKRNKKKNILEPTDVISEDEMDFLKEEIEEVAPTQSNNKKKPRRKKKDKMEEEISTLTPVSISEEVDDDADHRCAKCRSIFQSKNKLFEHLKKTGHSVLLQTEEKGRSKRTQKNKIK